MLATYQGFQVAGSNEFRHVVNLLGGVSVAHRDVMRVGKRIYNPGGYTRLYCRSANQLTCHVACEAANLRAFVLQQYLTIDTLHRLPADKSYSFTNPLF